MKTKKEIALDFLKLCAQGDSHKAFAEHLGNGFVHHNAFFKGDRETLMHAMAESAKQQPKKEFKVQRALEDGNLVAVHSKLVFESDSVYAVAHILKFEKDKIIEMWDFAQEVPKDMPNENGMF